MHTFTPNVSEQARGFTEVCGFTKEQGGFTRCSIRTAKLPISTVHKPSQVLKAVPKKKL